MPLNADYWNKRYAEGNIPWDAGAPTTPLRSFLDTLKDPHQRILIPGAGRGHEAIYLHRKGFTQVYVCDWAPLALEALLDIEPDFPSDHLLQADFFELEPRYDFLIEQTFFCAIDPSLRPAYAQKAHQLLSPGGSLVGLLWAEELPVEGPPFGGTEAEYRGYFEPFFTIEQIELAPNSIKPRAGRELFLKMKAT